MRDLRSQSSGSASEDILTRGTSVPLVLQNIESVLNGIGKNQRCLLRMLKENRCAAPYKLCYSFPGPISYCPNLKLAKHLPPHATLAPSLLSMGSFKEGWTRVWIPSWHLLDQPLISSILITLFSLQRYQLWLFCLRATFFVLPIGESIISYNLLWEECVCVCVHVQVQRHTLVLPCSGWWSREMIEIEDSQIILLFPSSWYIHVQVMKPKCQVIENTWVGMEPYWRSC